MVRPFTPIRTESESSLLRHRNHLLAGTPPPSTSTFDHRQTPGNLLVHISWDSIILLFYLIPINATHSKVSILDPFSFYTFGCSMHFLIKNTMINTFIAQSIHTIVKLLDH
ncbi:hypothetical protein HanPI659440_Chr03g0100081 [Helianthus annuus]|nr:hypothetical protein HanPI659440_Chr03g0100081 [Helianthus annuus]